MRSSSRRVARVLWSAWLVLGAAALRGSTGCGTQPCFRHSDCASSEVCSNGDCVLAPIDGVLPVGDAGAAIDAGTTPVVDSFAPVVDTSLPVVDSYMTATPDSFESETAAGDAGANADVGDSSAE